MMQDCAPWRVSEAAAPDPGESLNGFIARIAAEEGLPNTLELTSLAGAVWPHRAGLSRGSADFVPLAHCLRTDADRLKAMSYPIDPDRPERRVFHGASVDRRFIVHDERRFAPTTLARRGVHLAEWQLRPFPFCRDSWQFLAARCPDPNCRAIQRWYHASGIDLCDRCGEPLANSIHGTVSLDDRSALGAALDLFDPDAVRRNRSFSLLPAALRRMGSGDLLDLLVAVAGVQNPGIRCPADQLVFRISTEPSVLCTAIADAWRTLTRWPEGFHELASDRIATRAGRFGDGNRGATMRLLDAAHDAKTSPVLAKLAADLRDSISAVVSRRAIGGSAAGELPYLKATTVVALRRQRMLSTVFAIVDGEPQPHLDRFEVQTLSEALRSSVPMNHASHRLGISDHGVEQLEALGMVAFERRSGTVASDGSYRVKVESLDRLMAELGGAAMLQPSGWVRLTSIMRSIGCRRKPWGPVIVAMLNGGIRYTIAPGTQPIMQRVMTDPTEACIVTESMFMAPSGAPFLSMMSKRDAREVLNLHARHSTAILETWPSHKSDARTVPVADALRLARRYVSLGELAARTGRSAAAVTKMLGENGVPFTGPWGDRAAAEAALSAYMPVQDQVPWC